MEFELWMAAAGAGAIALALGLGFRARGTQQDEPSTTPTRAPGALKAALARTRDLFHGALAAEGPADARKQALEDALLRADVGVRTTARLLAEVNLSPDDTAASLADTLRDVLIARLPGEGRALVPQDGIWIVMIVGVNGSGKTTTIGKLAHRFAAMKKRVLLVAGDTYRAAAGEQLSIWAERAGVDCERMREGADPGAVVYKALERAKMEGHDVVLIDTAGRLQTRKPLMAELSKIRRVIDKHVPSAPHETLLVLDGTMGQNAVSQAELFNDATPLTGVVVTKLDGSAKGGAIVALEDEFNLRVRMVGLGEGIDDLQAFDPVEYAHALAGGTEGSA